MLHGIWTKVYITARYPHDFAAGAPADFCTEKTSSHVEIIPTDTLVFFDRV